jgi:hypothetical protein
MILGSAHFPTEISPRNFPGGKLLPARKSDNLTAIYEPTVHDPMGLHSLLWNSFVFTVGIEVFTAVSMKCGYVLSCKAV